MIVICKRGTKRLIKGARYEVKSLWNNGANHNWIEGKLELKEVSGRYTINNFTDTNGNNLPNINIQPQRNESAQSILRFSDINIGDLIICKGNYKTLVNGGLYRISEKEVISNRPHYISGKIKFEGINRWYVFNKFRFRALNDNEKREVSLNSLLNNQDPNIIKTSKVNKLDIIDNKYEVLMDSLCQSIMDKNRHKISIIDWACKIDNKIGLKSENFNELLDMKLSDILKKIDSNYE